MIKFVISSLVVAVICYYADAQIPTPAGLGFEGFTGKPLGDRFQSYHPYPLIRIIQQRSNSNPSGYQFSFETENHIRAEEVGEFLADDPYQDEHGFGTHAKGHNEYVDPEGNLRAVDWVADEKGYRAITTTNGQLDENQFGGGLETVNPFLSGQGPFRAGAGPVGLGAGVPPQVLINGKK